MATFVIREQGPVRTRCQAGLLSLTSPNHWSQSLLGWEVRWALLTKIFIFTITIKVTTRHLPELNGARVLHACGMYESKQEKVCSRNIFLADYNTFQWLIVAGGLNALEEVLSSAEILQHSNGALQVSRSIFMIFPALEVHHTTSVHPLADEGEQSQRVLPPLRRPV